MCGIFLFTELLRSGHHVHASERCTKKDWAFEIRKLLEVHYLTAKRIPLVMDNLNTHAVSSLYETFPPEIALKLARRLKIHYIPKHGSWLNIVNRYSVGEKKITLSSLNKETPRNELEKMMQVLQKHITKLAFVDITNSLLGIPCVKVILPELEFSLENDSPNNAVRIGSIRDAIGMYVQQKKL